MSPPAAPLPRLDLPAHFHASPRPHSPLSDAMRRLNDTFAAAAAVATSADRGHCTGLAPYESASSSHHHPPYLSDVHVHTYPHARDAYGPTPSHEPYAVTASHTPAPSVNPSKTPRLRLLEAQVEAMRAEMAALISHAAMHTSASSSLASPHPPSNHAPTPASSSHNLYATELQSARERLEAMQLRELMHAETASRALSETALRALLRHAEEREARDAFARWWRVVISLAHAKTNGALRLQCAALRRTLASSQAALRAQSTERMTAGPESQSAEAIVAAAELRQAEAETARRQARVATLQVTTPLLCSAAATCGNAASWHVCHAKCTPPTRGGVSSYTG